MSASQYRTQLERKRKQRIEAGKKAGEYRNKESAKRNDAAKARRSASKAKSGSTRRSRERDAERKEKEAETAGKDAGRWQEKAGRYAKEEFALQSKLARAEQSELDAVERQRKRDQLQAGRLAAAERIRLEARVADAESALNTALRRLPTPRSEKLRVLILGSSAAGDLRVSREQKRIRTAVESALHRDQIELDVRPAATTADLLDGITKFRPHIIHFSGHSNDDILVFEDELDEQHDGVVATASSFANAIQASDDPPLLVLLNSCNSASQIDSLVERIVPFAIGMSGSIGDTDAITYAAQFYAATANGQSIRASHLSGQAALELAGLDSADLPTLAWAPDVDPAATILVRPAH